MKTLLAGLLGGVAIDMSMLFTFCLIGFGWLGVRHRMVRCSRKREPVERRINPP